jgi:peptidoglycan/xylan/chitin deacetylase (PgdA/CDA1 family)
MKMSRQHKNAVLLAAAASIFPACSLWPARAAETTAAGTTRVAQWKDDKKSAFLLQLDDSLPSDFQNAIPELQKRGMTATIYLNPGMYHYKKNIDQWETVVPNIPGVVYGNHTMMHDGLKDYASADADLKQVNAVIFKAFPGKQPRLISFAKPGVAKEKWTISDEDYQKVLKDNNLVAREGAGVNAAQFNNLKTAEGMLAIVDDGIAKGTARTILFHGIGGDWIVTPTDLFVAFLDGLDARKDRVWITDHISAHKYDTERKTAKVNVLDAKDKQIRLELKSDADPQLYDLPLTLVTQVPATWKFAQVVQGANKTVVSAADGKILFEALPNGGEVLLTPSATGPTTLAPSKNPLPATTETAPATTSTGAAIISDAEAIPGWDGVTLIDDAKVGAHAVQLAVPAGKAGGGAFNLRKAGLDFSKGGAIRFWYRLTGAGATDLMLKLVTPTFADNFQTVFPVFPAQKADGQWHQATINLASAYQKWSTAPETGSNYMYFRTNAGADSSLKLDLDQLEFVPGNASPSTPATSTASATATASAQQAAPVANPGFEEGTQSWTPSKDDAAAGLSQVSTEAAHTGKNGLRVKQPLGASSWIQSARFPIASGKSYRLKFWARCVEDSGVGVFVNFFDAQVKNIPTNPPLAVQVPQNAREWTEYHLDFKAPDGAAAMTLAVHAYSNHACLADFDDFAVVPTELSASTPAALVAAPRVANGPTLDPPDAARVKEIASYLDATPKGLGFTLDNRAPWEALGATPRFKEATLPLAERFLNEPIPEVSEAAYAQAIQTGSRDINAPIDRRRFRLATFILAEGVENKGRFLPAIEKELAAICSESSWIVASHVKFTGKNDLGSAMTAWSVATAVSMLGDRLSAATRKAVKDAVNQRVVQPFLEQMRDKTATVDFWRNSPFNWNAVVHGGITGAALAMTDSVQERAEVIAAAEKETQFYINGFPKDGYSTEGMGYWKYGFGHYIMLSEAVLAATHGKLNLYDKGNARTVAQFPRRFEVAPEVYPAYSDSTFKDDPSRWLYYILDSRYGLGDNAPRSLSLDGTFSTFLYAHSINLAFEPKVVAAAKNAGIVQGHRIRDWFDTSQIYVGRLPAGQQGLAMSFKGANNGTSHGHNDLGSFVVVSGKIPLLVDPGSTVYNAATFGAERYKNQVINSYGHSVPRVAGQLQGQGEKFFATVTNTKFSDTTDSVTLDLTKGYEVPALKSLLRTFEYSRANKGSVTMTDRVEYSSPQTFGTALVTFGEAKEEKPGVWVISQGDQSIRVTIDARGVPFTVTNEVLKDEAAAGKVRRLGIDLNDPAAQATITVKIAPTV